MHRPAFRSLPQVPNIYGRRPGGTRARHRHGDSALLRCRRRRAPRCRSQRWTSVSRVFAGSTAWNSIVTSIIESPTRIPDEGCFDTDRFWLFPATGTIGDNFDGDQTILLHELLHQRGLVDNYAYEVVVGGIFVFKTPPQVEGLMGHNYFRGGAVLTEVCAIGLNLYHHRRSPVRPGP
jgi:hypothetical protein